MHGGAVFRAGTQLWFVPTSIAVKVMPRPTMARVPGGPPELRGIAAVDGDMIPIFGLGSEGENIAGQTPMLVCTVLGERLGLVGIQIVATGRFETTPGGDVRVNGEVARVFDVATLIAKVRERRWAATLSE